MTNYKLLNAQLKALIEDDDYSVTILSNASAILNDELEDLNWVGFYILKDDTLLLGPFQGKVACTKIKIGKGVCGTCIKEEKAILVENVHEFKGHIACDSRSNSEVCVPLFVNNKIYGLLDIDSPSLSRFTNDDLEGLKESCRIISTQLEKTFDIGC